MNIAEKCAYLKGLAKGLEVDESTKEGKLLLAIVDTLETVADEVSDLQEICEELDQAVDVLDEDLHELEENVEELEEVMLDCCDALDDLDEESRDWDEPDFSEMCEVNCPACGETVCVNEDFLDDAMECPSCGKIMRLDQIVAMLDDE